MGFPSRMGSVPPGSSLQHGIESAEDGGDQYGEQEQSLAHGGAFLMPGERAHPRNQGTCPSGGGRRARRRGQVPADFGRSLIGSLGRLLGCLRGRAREVGDLPVGGGRRPRRCGQVPADFGRSLIRSLGCWVVCEGVPGKSGHLPVGGRASRAAARAGARLFWALSGPRLLSRATPCRDATHE